MQRKLRMIQNMIRFCETHNDLQNNGEKVAPSKIMQLRRTQILSDATAASGQLLQLLRYDFCTPFCIVAPDMLFSIAFDWAGRQIDRPVGSVLNIGGLRWSNIRI